MFPILEATLSSADAVRRKAREFHRREVAPLAIGVAPSISVTLVLRPVADTAKSIQGLRVQLSEEGTGKLVDQLLRSPETTTSRTGM